MTIRLLLFLAALTSVAVGTPARACSVVDDYVRPSNFELVQIADAIVVATPEAAAGEEGVRFRVEQAVKGAPPDRLALDRAAIGAAPPSDLSDLSRSNPEGYAGPCNRMSFRLGSRYLLFLAREPDGSWRQLGFPFARINEDYTGENSIWMRTVRRYFALQQRLAPMAQIDALETMRSSGRTADGQTLASSERQDITDHLSSVSQWKPTAWLLRLYARAERGETMAMRPDAANGEGNGFDEIVRTLLGEEAPAPGPQGIERVKLAVLAALAEGSHPDALPLFERLSSAPDTGAPARGLILRYFARNGQFPRAYQWIETQLMAQLLRLERSDAMRLIRNVAETMRGDTFEEQQERWRSDPHAMATWPELALALYWYQVRTFGADNALTLGDAFNAIPVTDFRARPLLTIARGMQFGEEATAWAVAELARPVPPQQSGDNSEEARPGRDDPALLPLRVLVSAWSEDRIQTLTRVFCQGGPRRRLVLLALGQWGDDLYGDLLSGMADAPDLDEDERSTLLRAAIEFTARDIRENGSTSFLPDDEDSWLVSRLVRRPANSRPRPFCPA